MIQTSMLINYILVHIFLTQTVVRFICFTIFIYIIFHFLLTFRLLFFFVYEKQLFVQTFKFFIHLQFSHFVKSSKVLNNFCFSYKFRPYTLLIPYSDAGNKSTFIMLDWKRDGLFYCENIFFTLFSQRDLYYIQKRSYTICNGFVYLQAELVNFNNGIVWKCS